MLKGRYILPVLSLVGTWPTFSPSVAVSSSRCFTAGSSLASPRGRERTRETLQCSVSGAETDATQEENQSPTLFRQFWDFPGDLTSHTGTTRSLLDASLVLSFLLSFLTD